MRVSGHKASVVTGRLEPLRSKSQPSDRAAFSISLLRIALLTAAGAVGAAPHAQAARYYASDSDFGYFSRPVQTVSQRKQGVRHRQAKKIETPEKESAKPQGPLIISVSISTQTVRIYDANGFFAEAPVSTGMPGHPTPMGVFSVIGKEKLHHSNIYSGAPMPFMQRITWSGVAMHAGVLPGHPASHGCIRMPMAFAVKMYGWTRMGARVFVTPGDITPASFSHPLLAAQKVVPQPVAADEPKADAPVAVKADKAADADIKPAISEANLELRSTVGHTDSAKPVIEEPSTSTPSRERTQTADASNALATTKDPVTMTDASPAARNPSPREPVAAATDSEAPTAQAGVSAGDNAVSTAEAKSETAKPEAEPAATEHAEVAPSQDNPAETKSEAATAENKPAEIDTAYKNATEAQPPVQTTVEVVKAEVAAGESMKADETRVDAKAEAKPDEVRTETSKADAPKPGEPKSSEKPADGVTAVTTIAPASAPDAKKDQARLPDADKPVAPKPVVATLPAPKPNTQIAVFISRKDAKLYVRQNFVPLFSVPVTIAPSDRPLGTHVFTAQVDKDDANLLHWSVVSLPVSLRAERRDEDQRVSRRRKMTGAVEVKPMPVPDSPAEALDRITIPAEAAARIAEGLTTGGSIIVSDQGITAGETGEGTDFIVSLR